MDSSDLHRFTKYSIWTFPKKEGYFFCFCFFVIQPGFVAFVAFVASVASVASVAFVGVWLLWLYHAIPIYLSI